MAPRLDRIDHIHVFVSDRDRAERWYREVMGLARVDSLQSWAAGGGPLTLADASGKVHLALFERPAKPCRSTIALGVSAQSFLAWKDHLSTALEQGPELQDHQLSWSMYFSDPDGNPYEITSYDYEALRPRLESERTA